ncbi:hypothetical protein QQF64_002922 [Cirrhinus molitorella]|uniref:Uncharacterized protein n=1 Tax=Cirrhinus molitorella TaxID=172907 RepID=A0ABR3MRM9_9TELE
MPDRNLLSPETNTEPLALLQNQKKPQSSSTNKQRVLTLSRRSIRFPNASSKRHELFSDAMGDESSCTNNNFNNGVESAENRCNTDTTRSPVCHLTFIEILIHSTSSRFSNIRCIC